MVSHNDTVYPAELERRNDFAWREEGNRIYVAGEDGRIYCFGKK